MIELLVYIIVVALLLGLLWWVITQFNLPDPMGKIIRIGFVVLAVLIVVSLLLGFVGPAPRLWRW